MNLEEVKGFAAECKLCELHSGRNKPVFSKGNEESSIMICGMVPAAEENAAGIPFVGRSGKLLDNILEDAGLSLDTVYVTNLVKCFLAPGISLKKDWVDNCLPYIICQIQIIKPKVIITLGKDASVGLLGLKNNRSLKSIIEEGPYIIYNDITVIPTYHPSYLLRAGGKNHIKYKDVVECFTSAKEFDKNILPF